MMASGTNSSEFARRFRRTLGERGITQAELAETLKVSENTVSSWATAAHAPKSPRLIKIADALETTVGDLVGEAERDVAVDRETESLDLIRELAALELSAPVRELAESSSDLLNLLRRAEKLSK